MVKDGSVLGNFKAIITKHRLNVTPNPHPGQLLSSHWQVTVPNHNHRNMGVVFLEVCSRNSHFLIVSFTYFYTRFRSLTDVIEWWYEGSRSIYLFSILLFFFHFTFDSFMDLTNFFLYSLFFEATQVINFLILPKINLADIDWIHFNPQYIETFNIYVIVVELVWL
jgi:hypothetical protein